MLFTWWVFINLDLQKVSFMSLSCLVSFNKWKQIRWAKRHNLLVSYYRICHHCFLTNRKQNQPVISFCFHIYHTYLNVSIKIIKLSFFVYQDQTLTDNICWTMFVMSFMKKDQSRIAVEISCFGSILYIFRSSFVFKYISITSTRFHLVFSQLSASMLQIQTV